MWEKMYIKKFNILIKTEDEKKYTFILTKQAHFFLSDWIGTIGNSVLILDLFTDIHRTFPKNVKNTGIKTRP